MAIAFRSVGVSPGVNDSDCVIVKPTGLSVGDLMIAHLVSATVSDDVGDHTSPASWTSIRKYEATSKAESAWWKIADSGDVAASNFAFLTPSSGNYSNVGAISAWTGHDATTPINTSSIRVNAASTTVTANSITPIADCMIVLAFSLLDNNTVSGYAIATDNPASWSEAYDLPSNLTRDVGLAMGYALRPETSATGLGTATQSASDQNVGMLIAIAPAVAIAAVGGSPVAALLDAGII